jgi:NAD(P)-dependent dehydrogenase (short-subunit alcohol dehydrogenase family)
MMYVTSSCGLHGNDGQSNYATANVGISGFSAKATSMESARFGVTVNAISSNAHSRMTAAVADDKQAEFLSAIPWGRFHGPFKMFGAGISRLPRGGSHHRRGAAGRRRDLEVSTVDGKRFAGRVAIITGASRGIGLAIAERIVGEGGRVCILAAKPRECKPRWKPSVDPPKRCP